MKQQMFRIQTPGRGTTLITQDVSGAVTESGVRTGLCNVFVHHTSCSLIINENADPDVQGDLNRFLTRLVQDGDEIFKHTDEGPDDMSAHVRAMLTATSLNIPVKDGRLDLGTWQGLYLFEHRTRPHTRRVTVTVLG